MKVLFFIPKSSPNHSQNHAKSLPNHAQIIPKSCQLKNHAQIIPKSCRLTFNSDADLNTSKNVGENLTPALEPLAPMLPPSACVRLSGCCFGFAAVLLLLPPPLLPRLSSSAHSPLLLGASPALPPLLLGASSTLPPLLLGASSALPPLLPRNSLCASSNPAFLGLPLFLLLFPRPLPPFLPAPMALRGMFELCAPSLEGTNQCLFQICTYIYYEYGESADPSARRRQKCQNAKIMIQK